MIKRPLSCFLIGSALAFSSCFAVIIPEPKEAAWSEHPRESDTSVVERYQAIELPDAPTRPFIYERLPIERLLGKGALGHQFLFPGLPVTRLYLERDHNLILADLILGKISHGRSLGILTNTTPDTVARVITLPGRQLRATLRELEATVFDLLVFRRSVISGSVFISKALGLVEEIPFTEDYLGRSSSVELLSQLLAEGVDTATENIWDNLREPPPSEESVQLPIVLRTPMFNNPSNALKSECDSAMAVQRGWERLLLQKGIKFISVRDTRVFPIGSQAYLLQADSLEVVPGESSRLNGVLSLSERTTNRELRLITLSESVSLKEESGSITPFCTALESAAAKLLQSFLASKNNLSNEIIDPSS